MNRKISDKKLDKILSGNESYYLPTEEDQNRNVVFNDFAFHMLLSTATYLRNLAMMHSDFINYNYKSPNKPLNLEALKYCPLLFLLRSTLPRESEIPAPVKDQRNKYSSRTTVI